MVLDFLAMLADRLHRYLEPESTTRGLIMAVVALAVLTVLHRVTRKRLTAYLERQAHKSENAVTFLRVYDRLWRVVKAVLVIVAATGSFQMLGLTVGFLGTMLGWSLQVPIRGLAAWLMVIAKRPFRVGDRITMAGVTGDVLEIQLNHILLNQVGGTVQGEERSGRGIFVPNAVLFNEIVLNYNYFGQQEIDTGVKAQKFMLDEVLVRTTFGSDQDFARTLCIEAADTVVRELVGEAEHPPFVRSELLAWGVLYRVRYESIPAKRQEVSSRVTELIWQAFLRHPDRISFAFPGQVASVIRRGGNVQLPPMAAK